MYSTLPIPMMQGSGDLMMGDDGGSSLVGLSNSNDYMDPSMMTSGRNRTTTSSLFMQSSHQQPKMMFPVTSAQHRPRGRKPSQGHGGSQQDHDQQLSADLIDGMDQQHHQMSHHLLQQQHLQGGYVTIKSETDSPPPPNNANALMINEMFGTQMVLPSMQQGDMMVVGQNMEVGGDGGGPGSDVILVSDMIKAGVIESGEVVVGSGSSMHHHHHHHSVDNEIVIGGGQRGRPHLSSMGVGMESSAGSADDSEYDDAALVIDTTGSRDDGPTLSHHHHHHHHHQQQEQQQHHHHQQSGMGYDCAECGATMKSRGSLKKHILKYHPQNPEPEDAHDRVYPCTTCPYQTQRRDKLDKHMAKHLAEGFGVSGKKRHRSSGGGGGGGGGGNGHALPQRMRHAAEEYKCPMCPYKCTVEKALKKHQKLHLCSNNRQFVVKISCMVCGKDRATEADLRKHMKKHRDGRDFQCDICGFSSVQLKKIIQHRRMHTGEKPHLCPHCTYRSSRRDNLRSHVRRMHKKENMYIDTFHPRADQQQGGSQQPGTPE